MFSWFKKPETSKSRTDEPTVRVFITPLVMLLAGHERKKGAPLTQLEVLAVRDCAQAITMTASQAQKFYASMDSQIPIPRINPDLVWEEWQEIRRLLQ